MSGIILCRTGRALKPLVLEEPGVQIYSLEELCYYIYNNIYILTNAFLDEKLIANSASVPFKSANVIPSSITMPSI